MTLPPEQFNKLTTKEDFNDFKKEIRQNTVSKDEFHDLIDIVLKKLDNIEHSFVSNMAAHDRFEKRISDNKKAISNIKLQHPASTIIN